MTFLTPQEISEKSLYLVHSNSASYSGIIVTVPQRLKLERNLLYSYAYKYYNEVCKSAIPLKITITDNTLGRGGYTIIFGLARKMNDFIYRQKFITMSISPSAEPVDLELIIF